MTSTIGELAAKIAENLGDGWTSFESPHHRHSWHLKNGDLTIRFWATTGRDAGRLAVRGLWPVDKRNYVHSSRDSKTITMAATKTPEQIAREIQRRFLPWYQEAYAKAKQEACELDDYEEKSRQTALALAAIGNDTPSHRTPHEGTLSHEGVYIRYSCRGDRVRLTIDLSADAALEVVRKVWNR
jgi:hypothetical protein